MLIVGSTVAPCRRALRARRRDSVASTPARDPAVSVTVVSSPMSATVQRLGGDEAPLRARGPGRELAQPLVLASRASRASWRGATTLSSAIAVALARAGAPAAALGLLLQRSRAARRTVRRSPPRPARACSVGSTRRDQRQQRCRRPRSYECRRGCWTSHGAGHSHASGSCRTDQYFSSSSRMRPVPRTTHVSGSSST